MSSSSPMTLSPYHAVTRSARTRPTPSRYLPKNGFGSEPDVEARRHDVLNAAREGRDVGGARAVVGDHRERVTGGEADRAFAMAACEAGALDEPGGGQLHAAVGL